MMPLKAAQYAKRQKNENLPKYGKIASRENLAAREEKTSAELRPS